MAGIMLPQRSVLNVGHALDIRTAPDDRCDLTILEHRGEAKQHDFTANSKGRETEARPI